MFHRSLAFLLLSSSASAAGDVFQPMDYASRSGAFVLHVEPSTKRGLGPAHCRLVREKSEVWSADVPWTFERASVANDGTVVAYADIREPDAFRIAVFDPQGKLLREHDAKHEAYLVHGPALPTAIGPILVHDAAGLAFVRVLRADQQRPSPFKTYSLATGEFAGDVVARCPGTFKEHQESYEREVRVMGDTGLMLCHWWLSDYRPVDLGWSRDGGVFALVDLKGEPVWSLALPDDYTDTTSEKADDRLEGEVQRGAPILSVGPGERFALWHVREKQRVEYALEKDVAAAKGWSVREVSRAPFVVEKPQPKAIESIELKLRDVIALGAPRSDTASPFRDVRILGFTDAGDIELERRDAERKPVYVRSNPQGEIVLEKSLAPMLPADSSSCTFFDLAGERLLAHVSGEKSVWYEIDLREGTSKTAPLPDAEMYSQIAALADGGYVALLRRHERALVFSELVWVNADGSIAWSEQVTGSGPDDAPLEKLVYMGDGIAPCGPDTVALLNHRSIGIVQRETRIVRTIELAAPIPEDASWNPELLADGKGGLYYVDRGTYWHFDATGALNGSFQLARADGTRDEQLEATIAPDGRAWAIHNSQLLRFNAAGVVDFVAGSAPRTDEIAKPDDETIDGRGRVLVRDRVTDALHIFTAEAKHVICKVADEERTNDRGMRSFVALADGSVWLGVASGLVHFDAQGERIGTRAKGTDEKRSLFGMDADLDAVDPAFQATQSIERRPDGRWIDHADERAILPDGRRLILETTLGEFGAPEGSPPPALHLYSPENEPLRTIELPRDASSYGAFAVSARWVVIGASDSARYLVRLEDGAVRRFDASEPGYRAGLSADGKLLLVLDTSTRKLARYELP